MVLKAVFRTRVREAMRDRAREQERMPKWQPQIRNGRPSEIFAEVAKGSETLTIPSFRTLYEFVSKVPTIDEVVRLLGAQAHRLEPAVARYQMTSRGQLAPLPKVSHIHLVEPSVESVRAPEYAPSRRQSAKVSDPLVSTGEAARAIAIGMARVGGVQSLFLSEDGASFVVSGPGDEDSYARGDAVANELRAALQAALWPTFEREVRGRYAEYQAGVGGSLPLVSLE